MATQAEKLKQRIPFGKNGIKDGTGRVIRTDHPTMKDVVGDFFDGTPSRQEMLDKRIKRAVDGADLSSLKAKQDKLAGIKRRKA